jgi:hypothetical protein
MNAIRNQQEVNFAINVKAKGNLEVVLKTNIREMKKTIAIGVLLILAAITNPNKDAHIAAVKELILRSMNEKMVDSIGSSDNSFEAAGSALGYTLGMSLVDKMAESFIHVRNFVLFSVTEVRYQGNSKVIGIGAFGNVWILGNIEKSALENIK